MDNPLQPDDHYTGKFGPICPVCDAVVEDGKIVGYAVRDDHRYACNGLVMYVLPSGEKAA